MTINPGYIVTNVSKNALVGDGSKTFGKMDLNIAGGMAADECAKVACDAIFDKKDDVWVMDNVVLRTFAWLGRLIPGLEDTGLAKNYLQ